MCTSNLASIFTVGGFSLGSFGVSGTRFFSANEDYISYTLKNGSGRLRVFALVELILSHLHCSGASHWSRAKAGQGLWWLRSGSSSESRPSWSPRGRPVFTGAATHPQHYSFSGMFIHFGVGEDTLEL